MPPIEGYRHLARDDTHRGGTPRIESHNIRVVGLFQMYRSGMTVEQICEWYGDLPPGAVFCALAYAADFPEEMQAYMDEEERSTAEFMKNYVRDPKLQAALERGQVLP